jgi:hypothetical protein
MNGFCFMSGCGRILPFIAIVLLAIVHCPGQEPNKMHETEKSSNEHVAIQFDKSYYLAGDTIGGKQTFLKAITTQK